MFLHPNHDALGLSMWEHCEFREPCSLSFFFRRRPLLGPGFVYAAQATGPECMDSAGRPESPRTHARHPRHPSLQASRAGVGVSSGGGGSSTSYYGSVRSTGRNRRSRARCKLDPPTRTCPHPSGPRRWSRRSFPHRPGAEGAARAGTYRPQAPRPRHVPLGGAAPAGPAQARGICACLARPRPAAGSRGRTAAAAVRPAGRGRGRHRRRCGRGRGRARTRAIGKSCRKQAGRER